VQVVQWQKGRNFEGVLSLTRDNKVQYARKHNYDYIDASWIVSGASPEPGFVLACERDVLNMSAQP
jgi:hypothetical protein